MGFGEGFLQGLAGQTSVGIQDLVEANRRKKLKEQEAQEQLLRQTQQAEAERNKNLSRINAVSKLLGVPLQEDIDPASLTVEDLNRYATQQQGVKEQEKKQQETALFNQLAYEAYQKGEISPEQFQQATQQGLNVAPLLGTLSERKSRKAEKEYSNQLARELAEFKYGKQKEKDCCKKY